jgi:putative two-component system response regulator
MKSSSGMDSNASTLVQMLKIAEDLRRLYEEKKQALQALNHAHHEVLMKLAAAAEFRDGDTGVHIVRLGLMSEKLSLLRGESVEYGFMMRLAAPMHDVGKIGIPDHILKKPGQLTPEEREQMNRHAEIGHEMLLSSVPLFQLAASIALTHHERFDGGGYPRGLRGHEIPLEGRVVALVDYFDALAMDRCYRKALDDEEVIGMIAEQKQRHFDPELVELFISNVECFIALRENTNARSLLFKDLIHYAADDLIQQP